MNRGRLGINGPLANYLVRSKDKFSNARRKFQSNTTRWVMTAVIIIGFVLFTAYMLVGQLVRRDFDE